MSLTTTVYTNPSRADIDSLPIESTRWRSRSSQYPSTRTVENATDHTSITCTTCSMTRPATAYSDAQLRQLRARIYKTGGKILEGQTLAKCEDCTPDPDPERVCKSCGRSKRLREFSKAQRFGGEPVRLPCSLCRSRRYDDC